MVDPENLAMVLMTAAIIILAFLVPIIQQANLEDERRKHREAMRKWNSSHD